MGWVLLLPVAIVACQLDNGLAAVRDGSVGDDGDGDGDGPGTDTADVNALGEACDGDDDDGDGHVDEGWADADADGVADCLEASCPGLTVGTANLVPLADACAVERDDLPLADAWEVRVQWSYDHVRGEPDISWSLVQPVVANLDDDNGDGAVDDEDTPEVVVALMDEEDSSVGVIVALDGATGRERWSWEGALPTGGVIVADVDADGSPDVVGYDAQARAVALDATGHLTWTAPRAPSSPYYPLIGTADLDADGQPEVIADDLVLDGADGTVRFDLALGQSAPFRMAAVADVDLDGDQEIAVVGRLYDSDGTLLWDTRTGGSYGFWPVIVQADGDDEAEIGFVGERWTLWEHDGTSVHAEDYGEARPGPPCAGDFDGDGETEVAWPAFEALRMYELDGTPRWSTAVDDASGLAGCSGFDVDGDGALEVLHADESAFRILDGVSGAPLYANGDHRSGTVFEYPTVADVDHDGHAEIVVTSNMYAGDGHAVTVFEHDGDGWPTAGATWNVHDFTVTNVEPDGGVPPSPDPAWITHGVYRARPAFDVASPPDLVVAFTDACVLDCDEGPVEVALQVANQGGEGVSAGAWLSLYADDGLTTRWVGRWALPAIPARHALDGFVVVLQPEDVGTEGFLAVVDDDGTGRGTVEECDETNNVAEWGEDRCP